MSNSPSKSPTDEYETRLFPGGRSGLWLIPQIAVVVIFVIAIVYGYQQGWLNSAPWSQHGAATTEAPAAISKP
jgi:hypothetical protein